MSRKENKGFDPLLLKFGVALAVSFAGYLLSRLRSKSIRPSLPPPPSPPSDANKQVVHCRTEIRDDVHATPRTPISEAHDKPFLRVRIDNNSSNSSPSPISSDREQFLLPEFHQLVKVFDMLQETEAPKTNHVERDEYEQEIQKLNSMVSELREREQCLETQLLEYYGLKEQETSIKELQNRLKINNVEAKVFRLKIEALQGENKRLKSQVSDYAKVVAELEDTKAKIKELKKKLRSESEERKEQILKLKQSVLKMKLQEQDHETVDSDLLDNLQRLHDLEIEREELWKSKNELQRENSELAHRLESTQILATSMLEDPELGELHNEVIRLREENENLSQEVEQLQSDRCADAEALVYLKWVNACLRYELRNYQPPPGKTVARDLSKTLSPTSEAKAKQLIMEYAGRADEKDINITEFEYDQWSSSQSYQTDSGDHDEPSLDALSSNKAHHSKKLKLFDKLRRLVVGKEKEKDDHNKKAAALFKSQSVEDFGKVYSYMGPRRNSISAPSQSSNRTSLEPEVSGYTRLSAEEAKEMEVMRMNRSCSVTPSHRFVIGGSVSPLDSQVEKGVVEPDLARYAEALKESSWPKKTHRKVASYSAF